MFTDSTVTPKRLECLIDLLREHSRRQWSRADIIRVLQPKGLPDLSPSSDQGKEVIKAGVELGVLIEESGQIQLTAFDRKASGRDLLLEKLDQHVLSSTEIEPFYAPFYSYLLSLGPRGAEERKGDAWASDFNKACPQVSRDKNPFNKTKYTGLMRWYAYSGHGWTDPAGVSSVFQPNPYYRLLRRLPQIFEGERKLDGDLFIARIADHCPELDNGSLFLETLPEYKIGARVCTLGLSHALVDLHQDGYIRLSCFPDSRGWSIEAACPANDGKTLLSSKMDYVEYLC